MQTAQPIISSWQRPQAAAVPGGGPLAYVRGLAFTVWMISLVFGFYFFSDWGNHQELLAEGFDMKKYFYIGFFAMFAAQLTSGVQAWFAAPLQIISTTTGALLTVFFFLMALLSPLSVMPNQSLLFACATWLALVMLWLFWTNNYAVIKRSLLIASWTQFAWWGLLLFKHGLPSGFGTNIGDINRNMSGTAALAALLCGLFTPNKYLRWAAFAAAMFFIIIVTSRGSIVALTLFVIVYYTLQVGIARAGTRAVIAALLIGLFVAAVPQIRGIVVDKIFHVHSQARGIGSGFTGRTALWKQGLEWFWRKPILGYGFRTSSEDRRFGGVHSAFIKIFLEAGLIGGSLIIAALVIEALRRLRLALRLRALRPGELPGIDLPESLRLNAIVCGTICLTFSIWVYDQYYVNLGSPISIVLFLMLMAPTYITTDGRVLQR